MLEHINKEIVQSRMDVGARRDSSSVVDCQPNISKSMLEQFCIF